MTAAATPDLGRILGAGPAGRCDDAAIGIGVPRRHPSGAGWLMWYYCRDRQFDRDAPATLASGRVALATSADGLAWRRTDGPLELGAVLAPSTDPARFDSLHLALTDVTWHEGLWLMWYFGGDRRRTRMAYGEIAGIALRSGVAASADGLHWQRLPLADDALGLLSDHDVLYTAWPNAYHIGREWVLQYTVTQPDLQHFTTRVAASRDLQTWSARGELAWRDATPRHEAAGIMTRHVLRNPLPAGPRWLMVYTALSGAPDDWQRRSICLAGSEDGETWSRLHGEPILVHGAPGAWDDGGVAGPQLAFGGPRDWRLHYFGFPSSTPGRGELRGVGLARGAALHPGVLQRVAVHARD